MGASSPEDWLDALQGLSGKHNPLARLPHVESFEEFKRRALSLAREALDFADAQARGLKLDVQEVNFAEPSVSEEDARRGLDDYVQTMEIVVRPSVGGRALRDLRLYAEMPSLTRWGTLLRRRARDGKVTEWAPLGQLLPRPGLHFMPGETPAWVWPHFGAPLTIRPGRDASAAGVAFYASMSGWGRWRVASYSGTKLQPAPWLQNRKHSTHPFPPFEALPFFHLGQVARDDLDQRLGLTPATHPPGGGRPNLTDNDIWSLCSLIESGGHGRDDLSDLARQRVLLLGNFMEMALRRGAAVAWAVLRQNNFKPQALTDLRAAFRHGFDHALGALWRWRAEYLVDTNPLALLSAVRKVTQCGPGGLSPRARAMDRRDVHISHYGRLCAVETPESEHLGLTLFLAAHAEVTWEGEILTPLRDVSSGQPVPFAAGQNQPVEVAAHEGYPIVARGGLKIDSRLCGGPEDTRDLVDSRPVPRYLVRSSLPAGERGESLTWRRQGEVKWTDAHPGQFLGAGASLIPFIAHDDGARAMMGAKNLKQAIPLLKPELPWVRTGFEGLVADATGFVVRATRAGRVLEASPAAITVEDSSGARIRYEMPGPRPTQALTLCEFRPKVGKDSYVDEDQILAEGPGCDGGELALGANLLVGYLPWKGYNFEDAIVASDRLVRDRILSSRHVERVMVAVWPDGRVEPGIALTDLAYLEELRVPLKELLQARTSRHRARGDQWLIRPGSKVGPGTALVRVGGVEVCSPHGLHGEAKSCEEILLQPGTRKSRRYPERVLVVAVETERHLEVGDKLMGRHGNKGVVGLILPAEQMPAFKRPDGKWEPLDLALNPHGVVSRMNVGQVLETHLGLLAWLRRQKRQEVTFAVPPFSTVDEEWLARELEKAKFPKGKAKVLDPQSGSELEQEVAVGAQYILRLNHLAADKVASRGRGPLYSTWTRQAVRGRRILGGQRFGEMEGWALQAHDTPELLRELFTVKGDDVRARGGRRAGRSLPESFRILTLTLRGLGIETELSVRGRPRLGLLYGEAVDPETVEAVRLRWATPEEMKEWSRGEVTTPGTAFHDRRPVIYVCDRCERKVPRKRVYPCPTRGCRGQVRRVCTLVPSAGKPRPSKWLRRAGLRPPGRGTPAAEMTWRCGRCRNVFQKEPVQNTHCPDMGCKGTVRRRSLEPLWEPRQGGLLCSRIFGSPDSDEARSHFGHIRLAEVVVHPWYLKMGGSPLRKAWSAVPWLGSVEKGEVAVIVDPGPSGRPLGERVVPGEEEALKARGAVIATGPEATAEIARRLGVAGPREAWATIRRTMASLRRTVAREENVVTSSRNPSHPVGARVPADTNASQAKADGYEFGTGPEAVRQVLVERAGGGPLPELLCPAFLEVLPVVPPVLRDRFKDHFPARDTLEGWYARVLHWNSTAKKLSGKDREMALQRLQRTVECLLGVGADGSDSLSARLSGKTGLLRQPLLGKRVDYSARAVIVPNPQLGLDEVGLPPRVYDQLLANLRAKEEAEKPLVLLNRAPSLHKYSILAAHAVRLDAGDALQLNPLVCAGLGADFDGDTIAIHAPRGREAVSEAARLLPSRHLLSVANGSFNLHLAQDIVAGTYLLDGRTKKQTLEDFRRLARQDPPEAARQAQDTMRASFDRVTRAGLTFSYADILEPGDKDWAAAYERLSNAYITAKLASEEPDSAKARALAAQAKEEDGEAWELLCSCWRPAAKAAKGKSANPIAILLVSGARGDTKQLGQVSGFRGRIQNASGVLLDHFVTSDFRNGVRPLEYFLCCHATRLAMADKKIMTGQAGELARWLVEACYPMVIREGDCLARNPGKPLTGRTFAPEWLWGRTLAQPLSLGGKTCEAGHPIDADLVAQISAPPGTPAFVRSPLDCLDYTIDRPAICQACYGLDLGTGAPPEPGLAVGVVAGESIGERCTQLTMKTIHLGGAAGGGVGIEEARRLFRAHKDLKSLSADEFLERMDRIYKGVDHRHFEIVLRRMTAADGSLVGVDRIARTYPRHVLARASFVQAAAVLARELWRPDEARWPLEGYKERLMLGRAFRRGTHG